MDTNVRTYDPKKVIFTFGAVMVTGYMEGTFINVAQNGDSFETAQGADGGVDRINKNSNVHIITVTLKRTSLTNDAFSAIHNSDKLNNDGIRPATVKDMNGTSLFFARQGWIAIPPSGEEADTMPSREWVIHTGAADNFVGGNLIS
jgi:hypothetical protein